MAFRQLAAKTLFSDKLPVAGCLNVSKGAFLMRQEEILKAAEIVRGNIGFLDYPTILSVYESCAEAMFPEKKPESCPYRGSNMITLNGHSGSGKPKYRCRDCGRSFGPRTKTTFLSSKMPKPFWIRFMLYFVHDETISAISDYLGISRKTAYLWRRKVMECLSGFQKTIKFSDKFWFDETFVSIEFTGESPLSHRHRHVIVEAAIDSEGQAVAKAIGKGRQVTSKGVIRTLRQHARVHSLAIHDGDSSHMQFTDLFALRDTVCPSTDSASYKVMQPINSFCAQIKRVLFLHEGESDYNIGHYLDWICFKHFLDYEYDTGKEKAEALYEYCVNSDAILKSAELYAHG